jgi:hypothetical protein
MNLSTVFFSVTSMEMELLQIFFSLSSILNLLRWIDNRKLCIYMPDSSAMKLNYGLVSLGFRKGLVLNYFDTLMLHIGFHEFL